VIAFYSEIRAIENNEHRTCGGEADGAAAGLALILAYFLPRRLYAMMLGRQLMLHFQLNMTTGQAARAHHGNTHTPC
jgi:hypothetical protein